jgi:cyclase
MDRDGTQAGFDCELVGTISDAISIPVIASGGAGSPQHFIDVFDINKGRADAALAASIFHFGLENIAQLKSELRAANVPVRWPC